MRKWKTCHVSRRNEAVDHVGSSILFKENMAPAGAGARLVVDVARFSINR